MKKFYSLKGMKDYMPYEIRFWDIILNLIKKIIDSYGYQRIKFPIIENKNLFYRTIGENTNIIKQIYSFKDKNNNFIALRPEGTSICVRFGIEHNLFRGQKNKWWYFEPMFRYENTQMGRYREFYQLGLETFGYTSIGIEIELILLINKIFKILNINNYVKLEINSIGNLKSRDIYKYNLIKFFKKNINILKKYNLDKIFYLNPLKILDTKNIFFKDFLINNAPKIIDFIDNESNNKFIDLTKILKNNKINYIINNLLFRGLDYYNDIVFEWTTDKLGSQSSICAGGRYDLLSKQLGSNDIIPSIGLAIGWNRLILLLKNNSLYKDENFFKNNIDIYLTSINKKFLYFIISFSENIRNISNNINLFVDYSICNLKNKIRFIKNNNIKISLIIKNIELNKEEIIYKDIYNYNIENSFTILKKLNFMFNNKNNNV